MAENPRDGTPTGRVLLPKRLRGTPTFQTPHRPRKRAPLRGIVAGEGDEIPVRHLSFDAGPQMEPMGAWSEVEVKALVEFVLFHTTGESWPTHKP